MNNLFCIGPEPFRGIPQGIKGDDGVTPHIGNNGDWFIGCKDTKVKAAGIDGTDGLTPYIGVNRNWFIGTTDTGVKAEGTDGTNGTNGTNGVTPHIGVNGNWFIGIVDTGVHAQGIQGIPGVAATVTAGITTTLAAGSPATVTNVGTISAAVLNFGIPQGIPGVGGASLEYSELRGALGNSESLPQLVPSGSKISVKEYRNNVGSFQINPNATKDYFTFSKTGKYLAIFNLCVSGTAGGGMFQWGLESQLIKKEMLCTGTATLTTVGNQYDVSGTDIFTVSDITERYNLVNNSKIQVSVQGVTNAQVVNPNMQYAINGVRDTSGLAFVVIRLGDL